MRIARDETGLTLVEVLAASAISMLVLLAVLGAYSHGRTVQLHVQGNVRIQANLRVGMDRITRDLRMAGFSVPVGQEIGGTSFWSPAVFHASPSEIGFRADIDGGFGEIVCTPRASNLNCPLTKFRLDSISYYDGLSCQSPVGGSLGLVATIDNGPWLGFTCSGTSSGDTSISVSGIPDGVFASGRSEVMTIEQVYYRYIPGSQPPDYGRLERHVEYGNSPDTTFPPGGVAWSIVARQLTDFWIEYQDTAGAALTGNPLSAIDRAAVGQFVVFMEGYDRVGVDGKPQLLQIRTDTLARNLGP